MNFIPAFFRRFKDLEPLLFIHSIFCWKQDIHYLWRYPPIMDEINCVWVSISNDSTQVSLLFSNLDAVCVRHNGGRLMLREKTLPQAVSSSVIGMSLSQSDLNIVLCDL